MMPEFSQSSKIAALSGLEWGKAAIDNDVRETADEHRAIAEDEGGLSIKLTVMVAARASSKFFCVHGWA
jgi:hypothetical protein